MGPCFIQSLAWLQIVAGFVNLTMAGVLWVYGLRSPTVVWFRTLLLFGAGYFLSTAWIGCAVDQQSYALSIVVNTVFSAGSTTIPLVFSLYFTNMNHLLNRTWMRGLVLTLPLIYLWVNWQTNQGQNQFLLSAITVWGYHQPILGRMGWLLGLSLLIGYLAPFVILVRYYWAFEDPIKRQETRLVLSALLVGLWLPVLAEGLIPIFLKIPSFPLGAITAPLMNGVIFYAIRKYGSLVFQANEYTENLLQIMPGGLVVLDQSNRIQYANSGAAQLLGYPDSRLQRSSARALFSNAMAYRRFINGVFKVLDRREQVVGVEVVLAGQSKKEVVVSMNATNIYDGDVFRGRLLSLTDITQLKETERQLESEKANVERKIVERTRELAELQAQLTASVRSFPFGFAIIDRDLHIVFANDRLGQYTHERVTPEWMELPDALELVAAHFAPELNIVALMRQVMDKRRSLERTITVGPSFYRFVLTPVVEGGGASARVIGVVMLMEDVTEARTLQRSRDEFFSIASHELRTPLTAIRGNTEMILTNYRDKLGDPDLHEMLDDVHAASTRLIHIVNDFLDTSRLELGKLQFASEPIELLPLLRSILRQYEVTGSRKKVAMRVEQSDKAAPWVLADPDRLRQIIINLVGNAVRATHDGSITLAAVPAGKRWKIIVTDTGKGIPVQDQHLLFRKFQQASDNILTRDSTHGTGLGLYISRKLAEGMKGKLYLASTEVDRGSQFVLELPMVPAPSSKVASVADAAADSVK